MNAQAAAGAVSALFAPSASSAGAHCGWVLLYGRRPRYLLVPKHDLAVQRRCVRVFRRGLGALAGEFALVLKRVFPGSSVPIAFVGPAVAQAQWVAEVALEGISSAAVQVGTPGPYQKASVLLLDNEGQPLGLAKVAMGPRADAMVQREGRWLARLRTFDELASQVPRLLAEGYTGGARRFIATDLGPIQTGGSEFGEQQRAFLIALARASANQAASGDSQLCHRPHVALERLLPQLPLSVAKTLQAALADCERILETWSGPLVIAHGDFTPWNTRRSDRGIYVFDWEYARDGASPAYDALHWMLLPRALSKTGLMTRAVRSARGTAGEFLNAAFPDQRWPDGVVSGLVLHYLLDTLLFYGMSDGAVDFRHPVVRNYFRMIEGRSQWMA